MLEVTLTYIGGPTALIEIGGVRLLTDPTFDPAGEAYRTSVYTLRKSLSPALDADAIGKIDAVLLSHDHHFDNLDRAGREFLKEASRVLTTVAGAQRLGGNATGLARWQHVDIPAANGALLRITGTPARHGPADGDRGPVTGFVLSLGDGSEGDVYVSGDTVWYDELLEVKKKFSVNVAILNMGAARVKEVGPAHLTFTGEEGAAFAKAFERALIVPLHFEGWEHFSESRGEIDRAFAGAGLQSRLRWLKPGVPTRIEFP